MTLCKVGFVMDDNENCSTTYNQNNFKTDLREMGLEDAVLCILLVQDGDQ